VEVTVGALGLAEWYLHVNAESHGQTETLAQELQQALAPLAKIVASTYQKPCPDLALKYVISHQNLFGFFCNFRNSHASAHQVQALHTDEVACKVTVR
jgi:hypothetical protein